MISLRRLRAILSAWIGSDWPSYYTLIDTLTAYQCQQTAAILHDIARSMELSKADKVAARIATTEAES
jgi:ribosomal protein L18E